MYVNITCSSADVLWGLMTIAWLLVCNLCKCALKNLNNTLFSFNNSSNSPMMHLELFTMFIEIILNYRNSNVHLRDLWMHFLSPLCPWNKFVKMYVVHPALAVLSSLRDTLYFWIKMLTIWRINVDY